ncbi:MAG: hypothetical protein AAGB93_19280 [Planctomycetota bacterium]
MTNTARTHLLLALSAAFAASSCSRSETGIQGAPGDQPPGSPATVEALSPDPRVDLPGRVSVFLQVRTGTGAPAADLTGSDFRIYENEELVSSTESSQRIVAQPQIFRTYLHLLIDRSNSVQAGGGVDAVKNGAKELIEAVVDDDRSNFVKISWFDGSPNIHPIAGFDFGFSNDPVLLNAAIDALDVEPPFSTSTNLYGAVVGGIAALDAEDVVAEANGVQNRSLALVTFTDGTHQAGSQVTLQDAVNAIEGTSAAGVGHTAFTIGVGAEIDPVVLALLGPNGSRSASDFNLLAEAFQRIGEDVRDLANSFYFLSYCSPKTFGINDLRVSVLDSPSNASDALFSFDAQYFGGGCAFLDVRNLPELGGGLARSFVSDAVELTDGRVAVVGWRSSDCLEPGCGTRATAFVAVLRTSPAETEPGEVEDGFLDSGFDLDGVVELEALPYEVSGATSIVEAPGGGLVIGGWGRPSAQSGFAEAVAWAVSADGSTVTRSDVSGPALVDQAILDLEVSPSGGYVAAGFLGSTSRTFAVWKLRDDLALDVGYGTDGTVFFPPTPVLGNEGATEVAVDGSRAYVMGRVGGAIQVLALDGLGSPDPGFGTDGLVEARRTFGSATYQASAGDAVVDVQGRLVVGGTLRGGWGGTVLRDQPALWRFEPDGSPDTDFAGSTSSPTFGTGVVTLREGSTNDPDIDFGRDTGITGLALGPDGTILATGQRRNAEMHTDLAQFAFDPISGRLSSSYNFLGFLIDDGATADDSYDGGAAVLVLESGAIWTLGVSSPDDPALPGGVNDVPTVWVDRDPARAFPPIGQ